jgi:hypothetical protein
VLGTDLGQTGNPSHADGLQMFVTELMAQGMSKDQIKLMGRETPGAADGVRFNDLHRVQNSNSANRHGFEPVFLTLGGMPDLSHFASPRLFTIV